MSVIATWFGIYTIKPASRDLRRVKLSIDLWILELGQLNRLEGACVRLCGQHADGTRADPLQA